MKKLRSALACAALLASLLCCAPVAPARAGGSIVVDLPSSLKAGARTIVPDFASEVDSLTVNVSATGETPQTKTADSANATISFEDLATATWTISVSALKAGAVIGTGSVSVAVTSGATTKVVVPITFAGHDSGNGNLSITLSWPSATGVDYLGWSIDAGAGAAAAISTDAGTALSSATLAVQGLSSGSHVLAASFKKGGSSGTGAGKFVESVNVWNGLSSTAWIDGSGTVHDSWSFSASDFLDSNADLAGLGLSLTMGGAPSAKDIGFSSATTSCALGLQAATSLAFTPTASMDGQYITYSWDQGASAEIESGASSASLTLVDGTAGANTLAITVTAPDRTTKQSYSLSLAKGYLVSFDSGGGSAVATQTIAAGTLATEPPEPTRAGYTFQGWYTSASGGSAWNFASGPIHADTVLYAQWTATPYSIAYVLGGGANSASNPSTYTIESPTIVLADPSRTGYDFSGWYTDSGFTAKVTHIASGSTGAISLYAQWTAISYTITYNVGGGTNSGLNPATYTIESPTIVLADPSLSGYTFEGWFSDAGYATKVTQIVAGSTGALVLYAKWLPNEVVSWTISLPTAGTISFGGVVPVAKGSILHVNVNESYASYQWYWNGVSMPGQTGQSISIDTSGYTAGLYRLSVLATDSSGASSSGTVTVEVTN
jgi:uncharacterized repeat protein (TIGR02543 family)